VRRLSNHFVRTLGAFTLLTSAATRVYSQAPGGRAQQPSAPRMVELKASDGTILKASYFAAAKPGPGVLLLHQSNLKQPDT
jgi:hypothetical protein